MSQRSRRWLWLLLIIPVVAGLFRLRFDSDVLNLLPAEVPAVHALRLQQRHFTDSRELILTLRAPEADLAETAARSLAQALRGTTNLVRAVHWQPPWMENPLDSAELLAAIWLNQPPEIFGPLTNRLTPINAAAAAQSARETLATTFSPGDMARLPYDPFGLLRLPDDARLGGASKTGFGQGQELFASPDGTFRLLFVMSAKEFSNYRQCAAWMTSLKQRTAEWQRSDPGFASVSLGFTGAPAFTAEIATGMERDMTSSVLSTMGIIALLFWIAHRQWRPLLWIVTLVALVLAGAFALGGLVVGTLNVVSAGFAAILLGLAVDYGLVLYQEALAAPELSAAEIRRHVAPSILWSAVTTAGAFLLLNFSGLPGLAQLGTLVALGVALAALVMLFAYLPPLMKRLPVAAARTAIVIPTAPSRVPIILTAMLTVLAVLALRGGLPSLDHTAEALRPRHSAAYDTLEAIKLRMGGEREPLWLLTTGRDEREVAARLARIQSTLERAVTNQALARFELPLALWPNPDHQNSNREAAAWVSAQSAALRRVALDGGFASNALVMTDALLHHWSRAAQSTVLVVPTNSASRWLLDKVIHRDATQSVALAFVHPAAGGLTNDAALEQLSVALRDDGAWLGGWQMLGAALLNVVQRDLGRVLLPILILLGVSLALAFRRILDVGLSLLALALSGLTLLAVMKLCGWSWNLMNLMALPLLLGTGVDYSIHMISALRRHDGNLAAAQRSTGRALWLCGGTTIAGFGSLAWSGNSGLASLGLVCATGIACALVVAVVLLPAWWVRLARAKGSSEPAPSSFYGAGFWKLGLLLGRHLPAVAAVWLSRLLLTGYWLFAKRRRAVVVENLLPALKGDRSAAESAARRLFQQFAVKLVDLWRYESGQPVDDLFAELTGWEHFTAAHARGKGVLMITPHLGNWEFGGPLLTRRGIKLHVITLVEPGEGLTELRQSSRARWGIETLVIGQDAFAFVEVIKRLQEGATVALLVDRPPEASATEVELFGRPFKASIAAAELARASGAALVPVYLPRTAQGYAAHVLPEIPYDRATLGNREARRELTQKILRAFEPAIRQHLEQWFHFVPIWPKS